MERLVQGDNFSSVYTCLAMLSGRSIRQIKDFIDDKTVLEHSEIRLACLALGLKVAHWREFIGWAYPGNILPANCLVHVKLEGKKYSHLMLRVANNWHDPYYKDGMFHYDETYIEKILYYMQFKTGQEKTDYCTDGDGNPFFTTNWNVFSKEQVGF